jgi:serine phosphatase RsbU (regulator of sigma subunit)
MVAAKEILDLQASVISDIGKMMDEASRLIYQKSGKNMFVAACYCVIVPEIKKMRMVNAGMPSPLLIRDNIITQLPKQKTRYPLGLLKNANYKEQVVDLKTNDTLIFFTDGVSETYDKELEKIVLSSLSGSPEVTANTIMKQLKEKSGNILEDDATVLVVNITF